MLVEWCIEDRQNACSAVKERYYLTRSVHIADMHGIAIKQCTKGF
jgi:hypothetical protein